MTARRDYRDVIVYTQIMKQGRGLQRDIFTMFATQVPRLRHLRITKLSYDQALVHNFSENFIPYS